LIEGLYKIEKGEMKLEVETHEENLSLLQGNFDQTIVSILLRTK
jgi:hypothetical protein